LPFCNLLLILYTRPKHNSDHLVVDVILENLCRHPSNLNGELLDIDGFTKEFFQPDNSYKLRCYNNYELTFLNNIGSDGTWACTINGLWEPTANCIGK